MSRAPVQYAFPLTIGENGQVLSVDDDRHIEDMIEQVLFTSAGERVNRPTFGCGILAYVFEPASGELLAALQALVRSALQTWLGDLIVVDELHITFAQGQLTVSIGYTAIRSRRRSRASFTR